MKRIKGINSLSDAVLRSASGGSRSAGGDDKSTKEKQARVILLSSQLQLRFILHLLWTAETTNIRSLSAGK